VLASASRDSTIRFWNPTTRQRIGEPLTAHKGDVFSVAFSPRGKLLASVGWNGDLRLWDAATRRV
jgi:WD40 repeat protein